MNVPGMKRPNIPVAPVNWQNFWTGIFPYSLAEVTATFEIFALPMNLAATSILARVLLISSIYNPSGFARIYERSHVFGPHWSIPTRIPVERIIFRGCLSRKRNPYPHLRADSVSRPSPLWLSTVFSCDCSELSSITLLSCVYSSCGPSSPLGYYFLSFVRSRKSC